MTYDSQKHKLEKLNTKENSNSNNIDVLKKLEQNEHPEHVLKTAKIIPLIQKYNFTFGIVTTPFDSRVTVTAGGPNQIGTGGGGGGAG